MYLRKPGARAGITHHRTAAGKRIFVAMLCRSEHFIVNGRERRVRKAAAQASVGFDRCLVGRHCKQDRHRDGTAPGFFDETDLMRHGEKRFEGLVTKIDDLRRVLVRNQAIEQRHLAIDVANRSPSWSVPAESARGFSRRH